MASFIRKALKTSKIIYRENEYNSNILNENIIHLMLKAWKGK